MKWLTSTVFWGIVLIFGGILFMLQTLGLFQGGDLFWAVAFGLAGVLFLSVFAGNRLNWWALIPGFALLSIGTLIGVQIFVPSFAGSWGGAIVLGGIGLSFFAVYLANRSNWWAIIPGGVLLTLAMVTLIEDFANNGLGTGGIFFIGLGLTFALVAVLPNPQGRMNWAWIPAGALLVMGLLISIAAGNLIQYLGPAVLILIGAFIIIRSFYKR
jgi:hypothetical protein